MQELRTIHPCEGLLITVGGDNDLYWIAILKGAKPSDLSATD